MKDLARDALAHIVPVVLGALLYQWAAIHLGDRFATSIAFATLWAMMLTASARRSK